MAKSESRTSSALEVQNARGFTLIEIAIVMVIVGFIITTALAAYRPYLLEKQNRQQDKVFDVTTAGISEYILDNNRFPCPAPPQVATGSALFGVEQRNAGTGACTATNGVIQVAGTGGQAVFIGAVPSQALGTLPALTADAYHNRLSYAVSANPTLSGQADQDGGITILTTGYNPVTGAATTATTTTTAQFALISHGFDGAGSISPSGVPSGTPCRTPAGDAGDAENCDFMIAGSADAVFRYQEGQNLNQANPGYYDDRLTYSLVDTDIGWWAATDTTNNHIYNLNSNNVGIGTGVGVTPNTQLDVAGEVKIGNSGLACAANILGAVRYNAGADQMEYCSTTGWKPMGGSGGLETRIATTSQVSTSPTFARAIACNADETIIGGAVACTGTPIFVAGTTVASPGGAIITASLPTASIPALTTAYGNNAWYGACGAGGGSPVTLTVSAVCAK